MQYIQDIQSQCLDKYINAFISNSGIHILKNPRLGFMNSHTKCKICDLSLHNSIYEYLSHIRSHTRSHKPNEYAFTLHHGSAQISFCLDKNLQAIRFDVGFLFGICPWILQLSFADDLLTIRREIMKIMEENDELPYDEDLRYIGFVKPDSDNAIRELTQYFSSLNYYCGLCDVDDAVEFECMPAFEIWVEHVNSAHMPA